MWLKLTFLWLSGMWLVVVKSTHHDKFMAHVLQLASDYITRFLFVCRVRTKERGTIFREGSFFSVSHSRRYLLPTILSSKSPSVILQFPDSLCVVSLVDPVDLDKQNRTQNQLIPAHSHNKQRFCNNFYWNRKNKSKIKIWSLWRETIQWSWYNRNFKWNLEDLTDDVDLKR